MDRAPDYTFTHTLRVRYSDVDAQGVVYNANYLSYFDCCLIEFLRALGIENPAHPRFDGHDFVVVRAEVNYRAPLRLDDVAEIRCRVGRIGRSSITFELAVDRAEDPAARKPGGCCAGEIVWVYTHLERRTPSPIPDALRELLTGDIP